MSEKVRKRMTEQEVEARRLAAQPYLENGTPHKEIAERFSVQKRTVRYWKTRLTREGVAGLRVKAPFHRPARLTDSEKQELKQRILDGAVAAGFDTELWTCPRIQKLIDDRVGVHYHVDALPRFLHHLGFSAQKPERKARERDEQAMRNWTEISWPEVKKKPGKRGAK